jgi:hypothetical protein
MFKKKIKIKIKIYPYNKSIEEFLFFLFYDKNLYLNIKK